MGAEPPLPPDISQILASPCPFFPGKRVEETHVLVLVPATVNGEPLTLAKMGQLVQNPLQDGRPTKYRYCHLGQHPDGVAPASHWVLMTRDVIPGSRSKSYAAQQELLTRLSQKANVVYEVPRILDATVCLFMEYVRSGAWLYSDNPWTYTRCQEKYNSKWQLVVGGVALDGLDVCDDGSSDEPDGDGVGVVRKFL